MRTRSRTTPPYPAEFGHSRIHTEECQLALTQEGWHDEVPLHHAERAPLRTPLEFPVATQLIISNRSARRLETHLTRIPATKLHVLIDTNVATRNRPHPDLIRPGAPFGTAENGESIEGTDARRRPSFESAGTSSRFIYSRSCINREDMSRVCIERAGMMEGVMYVRGTTDAKQTLLSSSRVSS
jgi:hypothetical protein